LSILLLWSYAMNLLVGFRLDAQEVLALAGYVVNDDVVDASQFPLAVLVLFAPNTLPNLLFVR
jgi:hypothetical protein